MVSTAFKGGIKSGGKMWLPAGSKPTAKMGVLDADGNPSIQPTGEKGRMLAKPVLTNDKKGQYDPSISLSLEQRTRLAEDFISGLNKDGSKAKSPLSPSQAKSFVDKANKFSNGTVREYSHKRQFVNSKNELWAMSSNGKDFVYVGKFNADGAIE